MLRYLLLLLVLLVTAKVAAQPMINTIQITQSTIAAIPSCLHYKVIGICYWRVCAGPYCSVVTSPKVSHYIPDVVVSSFARNGTNPWLEIQKTFDVVSQATGQQIVNSISGNHITLDTGDASDTRPRPEGQQTSSHTRFKEVDVIGNPIVSLFSGSHYFIPSNANPLMPYLLSTTDAFSWRYGIAELVYAPLTIPGLHEIGHWPVNTWGPVYPRDGFINSKDDAKAAAVIAQRAGEIVTRDTQPHAYQYIDLMGCKQSWCGKPSELNENDGNSGQWQMLFPIAETTCSVFGENDTAQLTSWGDAYAQKTDGAYVWNLWRHYQGCVPVEGGTYLGSINF